MWSAIVHKPRFVYSEIIFWSACKTVEPHFQSLCMFCLSDRLRRGHIVHAAKRVGQPDHGCSNAPPGVGNIDPLQSEDMNSANGDRSDQNSLFYTCLILHDWNILAAMHSSLTSCKSRSWVSTLYEFLTDFVSHNPDFSYSCKNLETLEGNSQLVLILNILSFSAGEIVGHL